MTAHRIIVVGLKDQQRVRDNGVRMVSTVSKATQDWERDLSPFHLGPCRLPSGDTARCVENAWQFSKVYAQHADAEGSPSPAYWAWARDGWAKPAIRYPMGKGAKPLYLLWGGERLGYVEARKAAYWSLYRDAVRSTRGFARLQALHASGPVALFDFDGYDHEAQGLTLHEVLHNTRRPMGHAFVLKAMLLHGCDVAPDDLEWPNTSGPTQASLFD